MASMTVNDYIDIGTGGTHVATSWQFAKDKDFTQIIDESIKDYTNVKKWHSKLPKRPEDKSTPDAEEYYTELDELWGRCKILVGETESDWFITGPMSQRKQRVMVIDRTVENDEDPEGPLLTNEYISNSTALGWTEEVFDQDDPDILGPIIPEPEPEEPNEVIPEVEEEMEDEPGGDGCGGDPILPDMEFIPTEEEEDATVITPEEDDVAHDVTEQLSDVGTDGESSSERVEPTQPTPTDDGEDQDTLAEDTSSDLTPELLDDTHKE